MQDMAAIYERHGSLLGTWPLKLHNLSMFDQKRFLSMVFVKAIIDTRDLRDTKRPRLESLEVLKHLRMGRRNMLR